MNGRPVFSSIRSLPNRCRAAWRETPSASAISFQDFPQARARYTAVCRCVSNRWIASVALVISARAESGEGWVVVSVLLRAGIDADNINCLDAHDKKSCLRTEPTLRDVCV